MQTLTVVDCDDLDVSLAASWKRGNVVTHAAELEMRVGILMLSVLVIHGVIY